MEKIKIRNVDTLILLKNIIGTFGVKGISVIVSIAITPIYMIYFPEVEILGLWFTLISMLNWILNFDLGIGNGLRNKLVKAICENDYKKIKEYISSAYVITGAVSLVALILGSFIIPKIDWMKILNLSDQLINNQVLLKAIMILYIGIIIQFFLKTITSILYALQRNILPSLVSLISTMTVLVYMFIYKSNNIEQNLINLSLVNVLSVNIPLIIITIYIFKGKLKNSIPEFKYYVKEEALEIIRLGGVFFGIQISLMIISSTNQFLITNLYGPEYVVEYQIYFKLFYLIVTLFSLISNPIWSAVSKAWAQKNIKWIKKLFNKVLLLACLSSLICLLLALSLQFIINIWLGNRAIKVNNIYTFIFMLDAINMIFIYAISAIANGMNLLKPQMVCNSISAIIKIPVVFIISMFSSNWICIILINLLIMLPSSIVQFIKVKQFINISEKNEKSCF